MVAADVCGTLGGGSLWETGTEGKSMSMDLKAIRTILLRLLSLILVLSLACLWVLLDATPAWAQANTINYSNTQLENRDFSQTYDTTIAILKVVEPKGQW